MDMNQRFLNDLLESVFDAANDENEAQLRHNALTQVLLDRLEEAGATPAGVCAFYDSLNAEVHGYTHDTDDDVLTLYFVIDATARIPLGDEASVTTTPKAEVDRSFRRMNAFVKIAKKNGRELIEESLAAWELAELIRTAEVDGVTIELQVLTTGIVSERAMNADVPGEFRCDVRDLTSLVRSCGGTQRGSTDVDFVQDYGEALPCLVSRPADDGLRVFLTRIPGKMLADIYNLHRAALLERNVRTFLQFTGKVNRGIRDTLLHDPSRFLPYNNGLSATASGITVQEREDGTGSILAVKDFQVVNGGQTTASIASASRRDKADLEGVLVPMKLTVVPEERLGELVPQISRFANTQNKVQDSDFDANVPWQIGMEQLSRKLWTPPNDQAPRGTQWFYERSRGQYADEIARCETNARRKLFRAENPSRQKLTKTDLAKYLSSWDQYPHVVSQGAQKNFRAFMKRLGSDAKRYPSEENFVHAVAVAALFKHAEKLHKELGKVGYRANAVTYTIAALSHLMGRQLDAQAIWKSGQVSERLDAAMRVILDSVWEILTKPPERYRNVTEWAKREQCWTAVLGLDFDLDLPDGRNRRGRATPIPDGSVVPLVQEERERIARVTEVDGTVWLEVAGWAKETNSLKPWQRSLSYTLGRNHGQQKPPSIKQAVQGEKLLLEALRMGFVSEALTDDVRSGFRSD